MMRLEIKFNEEIHPSLYKDYSKFLYQSILRSISREIDPFRYSIREPFVQQLGLIKWKKYPRRVDLASQIKNCLILSKENGIYVIKLDDKSLVRGSRTKVSTVVRALEYGCKWMNPYPLVRRVLLDYQFHYDEMLVDFIRERMLGS